MSFSALVVKTVLRQRVPDGSDGPGICIGIATVVALGVITEDLTAPATDGSAVAVRCLPANT